MRYIIVFSLLLFLLSVPVKTFSNSLLFYEPFEDLDSLILNGGRCGTNGCPNFGDGVIGNSGDFSDSKLVCYPLQDNFNLNNGTIEFWFKTPTSNTNYIGFFDIGTLGHPNSWGIFKNLDHMIMEVKNNVNIYDQAWGPGPVSADDKWHFIAAVWERQDTTTNFKICLDGVCKTTYDGITSNSFPDLNGEFCIGWSGWYGYSESSMDEFKIFDYVKSDADILVDYESSSPYLRPIISLLGENSVVLGIGTQYFDEGATAYDKEDGDITENIIVTGLDDIDTSKVGAYRIAYNVNDSEGHPAKEKIRMVYVVDLNVKPVKRAFEHLEESMDKFHNTFDVYTDFVSGGNHGAPSGWMGYIDILKVDPKWNSNCYNGLTCFKNIWETTSPAWVGIRWLQPENNWGTIPYAGYDMRGATKITFHARGEVGGEPVTFMAGGVPGEYADSIQPAASINVILTKDWKEYTIDLSDKDLSYVISPFGWLVRNDPIFYIDDVKYNLPRPDALRFIQSFEIIDIDKEIALSNTSFVYDNALALLAFLARGDEEGLRRAKILADSLVFAMENDRTYSDGRLRNAYMSGDLSDPVPGTAKLPGWWDTVAQKWYEDELNVSTHTGNMAWAILALLSYYEKQGGDRYLEAAKTMGEWIERETRDDRGNGGYTSGYKGWEQTEKNPDPPKKLLYKATEHNIDLYPAFMRLYYLTNEQKWLGRAEHAKKFVDSMWNSASGHFWTGTLEDGVTINDSNIPVDIQAWAVLAFNNYNTALVWAENNCYTEHDGFKGFDFNNDLDGVWFEGTMHMAAAYKINGDISKADFYIEELRKAQISAKNANGKGIVAACHDGVTTGFDWEYFSRLHIGAASWYIFAEIGYNPYWGTTSCASMPEVCNGNDDNCNGLIDEGLPLNTYCRDFDGDGYGDPNNSVQACNPPQGYVLDCSDCDDSDASINPGATEGTCGNPTCSDGKDNDCDGLIDASDSGCQQCGTPDLLVSTWTAPANACAGATISIKDTTKNQGTGTAGASQTCFYFSTNTILDAGDQKLGCRSVSSLIGGAKSPPIGTASTSVTLPNVPIGKYYLIAMADDSKVVTESNETNNKKSKVIYIGPDLIVSALTAPTSATRGTTILIGDTTKNKGCGTAGASTTAIYLSTNTTIGTGDILLCSRPVPALGTGATNPGTCNWTIPSTLSPGTYYIIGNADDLKVVVESNELNNKKTKKIVIY